MKALDITDSQKIVSGKKALEDLLSTDTIKVSKQKIAKAWHGVNRYRQSLFFYTSIIEEKQKKVSLLQKEDPDLYAAFEKTISDMQDIYRQLNKNCPGALTRKKCCWI